MASTGKGLLDSHLKLLRHNNVDVTRLTDANVKSTLDSMQTQRGNVLSANYKVSVLASIKRFNTNITARPKDLKLKRVRNRDQLNRDTFRVLVNVVNFAFNFDTRSTTVASGLALIDTVLAVLVLVSTNVDLKTLRKLTVQQFQTLARDNEAVVADRRVQAMPEVMAPIASKVADLLAYRASQHYRRQDAPPAAGDRVVSCSADVINKKIKELTIILNPDISVQRHYGLRSIEKLNRQILLQHLVLLKDAAATASGDTAAVVD